MLVALHKKIDITPLIIFRILFGFLLAWQCADHLYDGTVYRLFVRPKVTFNFFGMDFLQSFLGNGMYWYHGIMVILALFITIGFCYRFSIAAFGLLWAGVYFMQKTIYNNHHYLLILLCILMLVVPAGRYASIDSKINPKIKSYAMPQWCRFIFIAQIAIVYFYAAVAKFYPDWLDATYTGLLMKRHNIPPLNFILNNHYFHLLIAFGGILFDLLVVPLLLIKKTRPLAAIASVGFHVFNWLALNIGIFPFLSLGYLVFFYPPDKVKQLFFPKKPPLPQHEDITVSQKNLQALQWLIIPYFTIQVLLPIRHFFIKGDVMWTEEGYRISWRMMLRFKKGSLTFKVVDKKTNKVLPFEPEALFGQLQINRMTTKADLIWQAAQFIKQDFAKQGYDVAVYANCKVSINNHPEKIFIDPDTDLAAVKWNYFTHNNWIVLYNDYTR